MSSQEPIRSPVWVWFKAERRAVERIAHERARAPQMIADLEQRIASRREAGQSVVRLEKQLARWRALID